MREVDWDGVIDAAMDAARAHLASLPTRPVWRDVPPDEIRAALGAGPMPDEGTPAAEVVRDLAKSLDPYVTAMNSGRFFGFVIGGLHPASYGADLLTATWDQNAGLYAPTPGATVAEEIAAQWLVELFGLPADSSVGFVTSGQMATFTALAAGRDHVLREAGWDVEADGLYGAPPVRVVTKSGRHGTVGRALRFLGLGERVASAVACDANDRVDVAALGQELRAVGGPTLVVVEAGNVNTGSFDDLEAVADLADEHRSRGNPTWVHVDGAVGLWARASERHRHLTEGLERLDSWSTDAHKTLNVSYDSGIAITRHPAAHRAAMSIRSNYLIDTEGVREPIDHNPEHSRRARGVAVYATLRALGLRGVSDLVDRLCHLAGRFASELERSGRATVVNEVVFNQVLVRWHPPDGGDPDAFQDEVMRQVAGSGEAFFSGTTYRDERLMRISVSDWATDEDDVDRALSALFAAANAD